MEHVPVLLEEVVRLLEPDGARLLVDATVGGGGHAQALFDAAGPDTEMIGLDWDADALEIARKRFGADVPRVRLKRSAFGSLSAALRSLDVQPGAADVISFDLGLSAFHVETPERGFSFRLEGPLDMRMDQRTESTAETLVNRLDAKALWNVRTSHWPAIPGQGRYPSRSRAAEFRHTATYKGSGEEGARRRHRALRRLFRDA